MHCTQLQTNTFANKVEPHPKLPNLHWRWGIRGISHMPGTNLNQLSTNVALLDQGILDHCHLCQKVDATAVHATGTYCYRSTQLQLVLTIQWAEVVLCIIMSLPTFKGFFTFFTGNGKVCTYEWMQISGKCVSFATDKKFGNYPGIKPLSWCCHDLPKYKKVMINVKCQYLPDVRVNDSQFILLLLSTVPCLLGFFTVL